MKCLKFGLRLKIIFYYIVYLVFWKVLVINLFIILLFYLCEIFMVGFFFLVNW